MKLFPTVVFGAIVLVTSIAAKSIDHRSSQTADRRALQEELELPEENCPTTFSLMHCRDPNVEHAIPCDQTTCLWDVTAFRADAPPGICSFISRINIADDLPDRLKPCILWNQFFGTLAPTISPKPTSAPVPSPTTDSPTIAPTVETRIFKISLDRKTVNLFFRSPSGLVNKALNDAWALEDLENTINQYIQEALRNRTGHNIATESVLLPIDDAKAPWRNATTVAAMALTARIKSDSSKYEVHEFHIFVTDALREDSLLERLQGLDHAPFERIYGVHVGPIYLEDAPSRDIQTDRPTGEAVVANDEVQWWTFWKKGFWQTIQWGDWKDKDYISFVVVMAVFTLLASLFVLNRCYKMFRAYKLERDVLSAAQLTMDEGSAIYALCDVRPGSTGETSNEEPEEESSVRSETFTYAEDDSKDIQSFSVAPGANMSALDFSFAKYAAPAENTRLLQKDVEDEESVGSKSTISHQPVDLEQAKGTVVCYDVDDDSLSTTSDSMVGSMLDFVRAAWQKKKPHSPRQSIFNQKIPKVPVARNTQSSVMAVVASLEAAAKSTSPKPTSPRKINLLSVVEEIERENQQPIDLESQGGTVSQGTEGIPQENQATASITADEATHTEAFSSNDPDVLQQEKLSFTPGVLTKPTELPETPEKKTLPTHKRTLEHVEDDTPRESAISVSETEEPISTDHTLPTPSVEGSKKASVLAYAAAFEKLGTTESAAPHVVKRTKKPGSVLAAVASFEQSSKKAVDTTTPQKDFGSMFRELAAKKAAPPNESFKPVQKGNTQIEPMKIFPIVGGSTDVSPIKAENSPVSILKPTVSKGSGSVMEAIKAFENKTPIPIEGRSKPINQSVSFDDSLPSLSRLSQIADEKTTQDRPSRDLSSPVRLTKLMDETGSNGTKKTVGTSSMSSASNCISSGEQTSSSYVMRTNLEDKKQAASPISEKAPRVSFFRARSKSEVEWSGMSILRSWSDKPMKALYSSPAFSGKSARKSKASKNVLFDDPNSPGLTPTTLPATPLSPIEYQESETSDIKSICSKECFGASSMR